MKIAIVGAGIIGLGLAYAAARRGMEVRVYERNERAVGASIRNFGMIWPIGQSKGKALERSLKSRALWKELANTANFWYNEEGSLLLARRGDEWELAEEFYENSKGEGYQLELWSKKQVLEKSACARKKGLIGGLYSATEMIVDPREAIVKITAFLQEKYKVDFQFRSLVNREELQILKGECDHVFIASGTDLETLYPKILAESGITKVKLQMLATGPQPGSWRMGPAIYGGLTLQHYASYAPCKLLEPLKLRVEQESPWFNQWGIHVMMSQNALGELIIGDTHEYGHTHDPFVREDVNKYVLDYLLEMAELPDPQIFRRWVGVYAKLPGEIEFVAHLDKNITLVNGVGGAGMTHSLGLGEELIKKIF